MEVAIDQVLRLVFLDDNLFGEEFPPRAVVVNADGQLVGDLVGDLGRQWQAIGGGPPVEVYDTFGPRSVDLRQGLPRLRQSWVDRRILDDYLRLELPREALEVLGRAPLGVWTRAGIVALAAGAVVWARDAPYLAVS